MKRTVSFLFLVTLIAPMDMVVMGKSITTTDINSDEENLAVRYENMIGLLVEAIKELKTEVEELKRDK